ncbi:MAG: BMP family ABC transporter substrate-binding protein [Acidimicrobiales bacterium]|nr:BMP family ABC transporter substrate-binding protein [Acidimicrobiales bacterium]
MVAGDRNDGGFYEGQADAVAGAGAAAGYEVIVVDNVNPGAAREAFENVARQGPDLIIAGGAELAEGFVPVAESPEYADSTFVMVTSAPAASEHYATVGANENEAHYVGGVAMGLLLERRQADTGCIVAGPELQFVNNMDISMRAGLEYVNPELDMLVTYTGDFEDTALAQEAITAQINQGCEVVYPYLGGALSAVVRTGNEAGISVASTSIDRCDDTSAEFDMAILYNPALYLEEVIAAFDAGEITEGEQWALFGVADGVGVGAILCDPSEEEQAVLDEVVAAIDSGEIAGWLG